MSKAILRIDDSPSEMTPEFIDYLEKKQITPVIFALGENIEKYFDNAVYALKKGAVIGNHSYSHPNFSELSFEQAVDEIEHCEKLLDKLYAYANVERKYKLFAFPYGDKGGNNKDKLQQYFKANGFARINDSAIDFEWYKDRKLNVDMDSYWTFDFGEYMLQSIDDPSLDDIFKKVHSEEQKENGALLQKGSTHVIMIHDHPQTNRLIPDYYKTLIDYVTDNGVKFIKPEFVF